MAEWKAIFEAKNFKEFGCEAHWAKLLTKISMIFIHIFIIMPQIHQHRLNANKT